MAHFLVASTALAALVSVIAIVLLIQRERPDLRLVGAILLVLVAVLAGVALIRT
ncbi:MAG: hypothetical protein WBA67_15960 [Jannaschia sp.]